MMKAPAKPWPSRFFNVLVSQGGLTALIAVCLLTVACGGASASGADGVDASATVADTSSASESASPAMPTDVKVCDLLTDAQVATVLPGHGGGVEVASGEKLFGDETRSYKCSYSVEEAGNVHVFTIDLTAGPFGVDAHRTGRAMAQAEGEIHREVAVADGGWVEVRGEWMGQAIPNVSVDLLKNPTEISLFLMVPNAHEKVDAVVDFASAIASALN